ncbi:ammonium transporter [Desulforudis sp. 1088]|uniref:ammonium transporter n=1 Tax=unclassified Candidatus Desulforudis TaxID=2635950 RepID=UPI003CE5971F
MRRYVTWSILTLMVSLLIPGLAWAGEPTLDTGDTSFILVCTFLVFLMTPGLAFFYGGMVRKKNVLSTMMHSFIVICLVSVQWVLFGYTLAFGPDVKKIVGNLDLIGLSGMGTGIIGTIPDYVFMAFQLMFAIITAALISGAIAERMRFPAFIAFVLLWTTLVYDPLAHWVWGGGWLMTLGALDFAGGTVVHISSGVAGLVAALVVGKRLGHGVKTMTPHSLPFTVLGAGLLWFGWFGFNPGSALAANALAANALVTTNTAAASAALGWVIAEWLRFGKPTVLGAASGCIAGLVAITPAAGFVTPLASIIIGLVGGVVCFIAVAIVKGKLGYDDSLDAFGVHGVGGMWGALATGLFACPAVNELGTGLFYGNPAQLGIQAIGVIATISLSGILTFIILKVIGLFTPLRATVDEEEAGLDITLHGESAYHEGGGAVRDGGLVGTPAVS